MRFEDWCGVWGLEVRVWGLGRGGPGLWGLSDVLKGEHSVRSNSAARRVERARARAREREREGERERERERARERGSRLRHVPAAAFDSHPSPPHPPLTPPLSPPRTTLTPPLQPPYHPLTTPAPPPHHLPTTSSLPPHHPLTTSTPPPDTAIVRGCRTMLNIARIQPQ